ncbi:virion core protein [Nile crocodilepox virus]|uniref:Virion core protein n=1 Tax=Nile crocodilepox virus (isolate Crocodylus niloticus/Zimbabwe/Ume/2001) TaxID=1289473 RepID=Q070E1_CPRVZ|nr:virion core protein [Nile crocodilepox virus]ABJ09002.1 virion core protein [Nile crocodilepox virus]
MAADLPTSASFFLRYDERGNVERVYAFEENARFDDLSIYQVVKTAYLDDPEVSAALFPSKTIYDSFEPKKPLAETGPARADRPAGAAPPDRVALFALLFNAFRSCSPDAPYFYARAPG